MSKSKVNLIFLCQLLGAPDGFELGDKKTRGRESRDHTPFNKILVIQGLTVFIHELRVYVLSTYTQLRMYSMYVSR